MTLNYRITLSISILLCVIISSSLIFVNKYVLNSLETSHLQWSKTFATALAGATLDNMLEKQPHQVREILRRTTRSDQRIAYIIVFDFQGKIFAHTFDKAFSDVLDADDNAVPVETGGIIKTFYYHDKTITETTYPLIKGLKAHIQIGINRFALQKMKRITTNGIIIINAAILFFGLIISFFVTKKITWPVRVLSKAMDEYAHGNSVELPVFGKLDTDTKKLVNSFEEMVRQKNHTQKVLEEYKNSLEKKVEQRTKSLQFEIAGHKRTAKALIKARMEAEQANRAKSIFLASMSHELRTPLNAILGYVQLLVRNKNFNDKQRHALDVIYKSGEHLLSLINDVLDLTKIESGKMELYNTEIFFRNFIGNIADIIQTRAQKKSINFFIEIPDTIPEKINADEIKLRQVLLNLLGNAVKFTDQGHVRFAIYSEQLPVNNCSLPGNTAYSLLFIVKDTGSGISSDKLGIIFSPFEQTGDIKTRAQGTGLGLAITQKLVNLMNGELTVTSEPGKGSCFIFKAIFNSAQVPQQNNIPGKSSIQDIIGYKGKRKKILVADDNPDNLAILENMLKPLGFEVISAKNGQDAINKLETKLPDLILMDMVMPVMSGIEAVREIQKHPVFTQIPVIAVSASAMDSDKNITRIAGCNDFLAKPIYEKDLYLILEKYLDLTWEYEFNKKNKAQVIDAIEISANDKKKLPGIIPPPHEEMMKLQKLAMIGNMKDIKKHADHIASLGEKYHAFNTILKKLAGDYEDGKIMEFVEKYMKKTIVQHK